MNHLTRAPISVTELVAAVASPTCGGTCLFLGTVRDAPEDGGVTGIEYSGYDAMANAELDRILAEVVKRWPNARVAVRHRLGLVPTEEASLIEEVKQRLPIWKKELRADGSTLWVDPQGRPAVVGPDGT